MTFCARGIYTNKISICSDLLFSFETIDEQWVVIINTCLTLADSVSIISYYKEIAKASNLVSMAGQRKLKIMPESQ